MMKIAVPTRDNRVDDHFGHCEKYSIFNIDEDQKIESFEMLDSPQGCGCKSNIASVLQAKEVTIMLAGNMGEGALRVLSSHGIQVFRGCSGDVKQITEAFLKGAVIDSGRGCQQNHHGGNNHEGHQCNH
jgi:predicted Fe-Mo cluster-binding NifX family protein